jgi:hypothetical protein
MENFETFQITFNKALKANKLKKYDVCAMLNCSSPTLQKKVLNPIKFTIQDLCILDMNGLKFWDYFIETKITDNGNTD